MGCSRKNRRVWGHTFFKPSLEYFVYLLYPLEIPDKSKFRPNRNCSKLCYIPWKFQYQKPRPQEIPHNFFLVIAWKSICYFFDTPGNSISSTSLFVFFSGIAQYKKGVFFHLILVGIISILILSVSVKIRGLRERGVCLTDKIR